MLRFDSGPRRLSYTELRLDLDTRLARRFRKAYWALAEPPARILANWENGWAVELRLTVRGDTIVGIAYYTNDVGSTRRTSIRAVRVTCPAEMQGLLPNQRLKLAARVD